MGVFKVKLGRGTGGQGASARVSVSSGAAPSSVAATFLIPKGLRLKAQGCEACHVPRGERATLGMVGLDYLPRIGCALLQQSEPLIPVPAPAFLPLCPRRTPTPG